VRGWWERDDRFLEPDELVARSTRGEPEGDHIISRYRAPV
jgi:hypothetical protein